MSSYKCSKCDYISNTKGLIKKHIDNNVCKDAELIENIIKLKCEICSKEYDTEKLLTNHQKKCIEKKAYVVNSYVDPNKMETMVLNLTLLVKSLSEKIDNVQNDNKELRKIVEKLQKTSKQDYDDLENEDETACDHEEIQSCAVESRKQVFEFQGWTDKNGVSKAQIKVLLKGELKNAVVNAVAITVDNVRYAFREEDRGKDKLASSLMVAKTIFCQNPYVCKRLKDGKLLCNDHL